MAEQRIVRTTGLGLIGVVDDLDGELAIYQAHALKDLEVLDKPAQMWTYDENIGICHYFCFVKNMDFMPKRVVQRLASHLMSSYKRFARKGTWLFVWKSEPGKDHPELLQLFELFSRTS